MECGLLPGEIVLRLARVEECVAGALCFRLLSGPSDNNRRVDHLFRELSLQSSSSYCRLHLAVLDHLDKLMHAVCSLGRHTASAQLKLNEVRCFMATGTCVS